MVRVGSPAELIAQLAGDHVIELELEMGNDARLTREELLALPSVAEAQLSGEGLWSISSSQPEVGAAATLALVERKGVRLARLVTRKASLEDVFVALTGSRDRQCVNSPTVRC
jgi:ABC-type uncharacterized transport system ATPase subunit